MLLNKEKIENVAIYGIFAAFFIIMLVIMHPAWFGS